MLDNRDQLWARFREGRSGSGRQQQAQKVAFGAYPRCRRDDKEGQILYAGSEKSPIVPLSQPNLFMDKVQKVVQTL